MNEGIQYREDCESAGPEAGYSNRWWWQTWRMVEQGWRSFCARRGLDPDAPDEDRLSFRQQSHAEARQSMGRAA